MTPVRFAVFGAARTGSNLLCGLLNSHPRILCHHGLFNPKGIHYALDHRDGSFDFGSAEDRDRDPAAFLARVWGTSAGMAAVGFKFNPAENSRAMQLVAEDSGVGKILLSRRNRIRAYISAAIAEQTGEWESYGAASPAMPRSVILDSEALRRHAVESDSFYAGMEQTLSRSGQDSFRIEYESLSSPSCVGRLLEFLGLPGDGANLTAPSFKRNALPLRDLIANFDQIAAALHGSALEADLYREDLPPVTAIALRAIEERIQPWAIAH